MSYLHHSERFREKIHFFILSGECLASLSFVQSSVQKLLLAWVPWGSLYSSPAGGGGSHSLYSLEEAREGVRVAWRTDIT